MNEKLQRRSNLKNQRIWNRKDKLNYIDTYIDSNDSQMLEIGPSISPLWSAKKYEQLRYLEVVDAQGLQERARKKNTESPIEHVHYLFDGERGFKESIKNSDGYRYTTSSHVIEHIPDFVSHLKEISEISVEDGYYFAIVPDKNLVFDKARPNSSLGGVVSRHVENRTCLASAIDSLYYSLRTDDEQGKGWWNSNEDLTFVRRTNKSVLENLSVEKLAERIKDGWDGHYHVFDPLSFAEIIIGLRMLKLLDMSLCDIVSTGHMDFIAVFKNDGGASHLPMDEIIKRLANQNYPFLETSTVYKNFRWKA